MNLVRGKWDKWIFEIMLAKIVHSDIGDFLR